MMYHVHHTTTYRYREAVSLCHNVLHLKPRWCPHQVCQREHLQLEPEPAVIDWHTDYFGNPVAVFTIPEPHQVLKVTSQIVVEVHPRPVENLTCSPAWESVRKQLVEHASQPCLDAYQFAFDSMYIPRSDDLLEYAMPSFPADRPLLEGALDLTQRIHRDFRYDPRATTIATPLRDVLANRRGVCQDFAHLQIGCLRSLGLAARYVSGYLQTSPPPGQPRLVGADASHAWLSVFCPELGWVDFDPTNNVIPALKHITMAWGRDYDDVSPIKGVILGGGHHTVEVAVDVVASDKRA